MKPNKPAEKKQIDKKLVAVFVVLFVTILAISVAVFDGSEKITFLKALQAAVVQVQLVISPAVPVTSTMFPNHAEVGDTIVVRISGQNFISGWDPVEKIILVPAGGAAAVYTSDVHVKDANTLTASIDTASLAVGLYEVKVVNQFMGRDITSTTYNTLSINNKTQIVSNADGATFPVVHVAMESALDHTVAETIAVSNQDNSKGTFMMEMPGNFLADATKVLNLHVDSYDGDAYKTSAGSSGSQMPEDKAGIGAVYDIKFSTSDGGAITSTDKPINLTFHYSPSSMAQKGVSAATLKVYHWNEVTGVWEIAPDSQVSILDNTVSASVSKFSPYTVFGSYVCNDGIDNDGDGKIDYPADPMCKSPEGGSEDKPRPNTVTGGGSGILFYSKVSKRIAAETNLSNTSKDFKFPLPFVKVDEQPELADRVKTSPMSPRGNLISNTANVTITKPLQFGLTDNQVKLLQQQLTKAGFYSGQVTGYFGDFTRGAVMAYQQKNGITQTGVVGPLTMAKLNAQSKIQVTKNIDTGPVNSVKTKERVRNNLNGGLLKTSVIQPEGNLFATAQIITNVGRSVKVVSSYVGRIWKSLFVR